MNLFFLDSAAPGTKSDTSGGTALKPQRFVN